MNSTNVYVVNAFTKNNKGGNPAGVVLDSSSLSEQEMQHIAQEMGFSETAFIQKSPVADYNIRFFTPSKEVNLCGHATIASFHLLLEQQKIKAGNYHMQTKAGILEIICQEDGLIYMQQNTPQFSTTVTAEEIAPCLELTESDFPYAAQIVSTGLRKIFAPIKDLATLEKISPNYEKIISISKKHDVIGIYTFTLDVEEATARCRNFAPLYGIYEDAATGTSAAALSCYLIQHNLVKVKPVTELSFQQGYSINEPSLLCTRIQTGEQYKVEVAGFASTVEQKTVTIG